MGDQAFDALREVIAHSRAQNGRFFGYVQGPGEPIAALGDLVASILTQNITAWRSSPAGVTIERTVVRWLAEAVGCHGFSGTLTGGGSAANLMGLAMARESRIPANDRGIYNAGAGVIYASEQVHMAVPKAVAMLGIGRDNLHYVPCDDSYRMVPSALERAIRTDEAQGRKPIAVVASAGTVNTGSIDPLSEIAVIARAHDLWLHVDGAYGALAAIAIPQKFDGLAQADSLSLDPHKWLYQPLDCGCLLYRDAGVARKTFSYTGSYAKQLSSDPIEGFAFFEESMELSRRFRALKLWLSLRYHGLRVFPRRNPTGSRPCTTPGSRNQRLASTGDCWSCGAKRGLLPPPGERGRFRRSAKSFQPGVTQTYRESRESLSFEHGIEGKILPSRLHRESPHNG